MHRKNLLPLMGKESEGRPVKRLFQKPYNELNRELGLDPRLLYFIHCLVPTGFEVALKDTDSYTTYSVHKKKKTSQLLRSSTAIPGIRSERNFSPGSSQRGANHILCPILQDVQQWGSWGCLLAFFNVGWWHKTKPQIYGAILQGAKPRQARWTILWWPFSTPRTSEDSGDIYFKRRPLFLTSWNLSLPPTSLVNIQR